MKVESIIKDKLSFIGGLSDWWLLWGEDTSSLYFLVQNGWDLELIGQGRRDKRCPNSEPMWVQWS